MKPETTIQSKTVQILLGSLVIIASTWTLLYARHFQEIVAIPKNTEIPQASLQETFTQFDEHIKPILEKKCFACHTDTTDRPFFYYIPVIDLLSKPYTENEILLGRRHFDFSEGIPRGRLGAAMEMVLRLRAVIEENAMPPVAYSIARPYNLLNDEEEKIILDWAEKGAEALVTELMNVKGSNQETNIDTSNEFAETLANNILAACPLSDPGDVTAHDRCADTLTTSSIFKTRMHEPFLWGGQKAPGDYKTYHTHVTRFNPLLFRKLYLSLFMFEGSYQVDHDGELLAYRFPVQFRNQLPDGEYPYPFWHAKNKWKKYNESAELILLVRQGKIIGAFRSANKRTPLPSYRERTWNGTWLWNNPDSTVLQPRVTNYDAIFSPDNPYVKELDKAYWNLSLGFRSENCMVCHSPSNVSEMQTLELLSSPGHALGARNRILAVFEDNSMPPVSGIQSIETRKILSELAKAFKKLADKALDYEGENIKDHLARPTFL
ncbi:heme-binding domain-containing protein [Nitrospira sp. M1]